MVPVIGVPDLVHQLTTHSTLAETMLNLLRDVTVHPFASKDPGQSQTEQAIFESAAWPVPSKKAWLTITANAWRTTQLLQWVLVPHMIDATKQDKGIRMKFVTMLVQERLLQILDHLLRGEAMLLQSTCILHVHDCLRS